ncbi:MAG TPA: hydantoinase/oxoprolinase family protein [Terracidiphilus sp.]|nr:hydantoinase/oxoprolinase family protein [Terracidiphilus sp.]
MSKERPILRVAIDTGGTFTDCVYLADGRLKALKVFSSHADPGLAVLECLRQVCHGGRLEVLHGTTVGTNTMLEGTGARVAFVTTEGFEDTIAIGRQARARLYDWFAPAPVCLVPKELRFGVPERVSAEGEILRAPSSDELSSLVERVRASGAESVSISLLFCFENSDNEKRVEEVLRGLRIPVSTSQRILPEFREYERASTTVVNAYLAPKIGNYLGRLEDRVAAEFSSSRVDVMQSSGGIIPAHVAADQPVRTVMSGPAGGVVGACTVARWAGYERIIGFDMGGTSTDVFLADTGEAEARLTRESVVAGVPIAVPMLDIHTAGAGGGSIARFDAGGMLRVGPESAGADPGPICFGRGTRATVTDANFVLGRLDPESFLGGGVRLDRGRAARMMVEQKGPLKSVEEFAAGILRVVETNMEKAIRVISVERGHDPRECTLVAFGGGGPLHACALARALRMKKVLIPAMPGALSALGILLAPAVRDFSRTVMMGGDEIGSVKELFLELEREAREECAASGMEGAPELSIDVRYRRQGYELNVPYDAAKAEDSLIRFHRLHQRRYGFCRMERPVEIVNLRLRMVATAEAYVPERRESRRGNGSAAWYAERPIYFDDRFLPAQFFARERLEAGDVIQGPAMVTEYTSATLIPPGGSGEVDALGNLILTVKQEDGQ